MKWCRWTTVQVVVVLVWGLAAMSCRSAEVERSPETLLLKDYRPESIYRIPRTAVEKAAFPAIDVHTHDYVKTDEEVDAWVQLMDEVGIRKSVIMTSMTGPEFDDVYARFAGRYPDRFEIWCGFDYTGYDQPGFGEAAVRELERCVKVGARGVGELGDKGKGLFYSRPTPAWGMHIDDPRMDPLLRKCAELNLPVNIHVAEPYWMYLPMDEKNDGLMNAYEWRLDNQPGILSHEELMMTLERACARHPQTTFIACHFANCCFNLERLGQMLDQYPNLYADLAARYAETATIPRFVGRFLERYQDRILYGTDMGPTRDMYQVTFRILESEDEHFYDWRFGYHWALNGFALPEEVLVKIYRENALRLGIGK